MHDRTKTLVCIKNMFACADRFGQSGACNPCSESWSAEAVKVALKVDRFSPSSTGLNSGTARRRLRGGAVLLPSRH